MNQQNNIMSIQEDYDQEFIGEELNNENPEDEDDINIGLVIGFAVGFLIFSRIVGMIIFFKLKKK